VFFTIFTYPKIVDYGLSNIESVNPFIARSGVTVPQEAEEIARESLCKTKGDA